MIEIKTRGLIYRGLSVAPNPQHALRGLTVGMPTGAARSGPPVGPYLQLLVYRGAHCGQAPRGRTAVGPLWAPHLQLWAYRGLAVGMPPGADRQWAPSGPPTYSPP